MRCSTRYPNHLGPGWPSCCIGTVYRKQFQAQSVCKPKVSYMIFPPKPKASSQGPSILHENPVGGFYAGLVWQGVGSSTYVVSCKVVDVRLGQHGVVLEF